MDYVIVGNSAAAVFAVEAIRCEDPGGKITLISTETGPPYSRCLLPYYLEGQIQEEGLWIRPPSFYEALGVRTCLGRRAVKVRPASGVVVLAGGEEVPYDRLLIATGAAARIPPIPGREACGVFTFRNLEDARQLKSFAAHCRQAVVIGGGLVGVEAAAALRGLGLAVTIVEFLPYLLPQALDERGASLIAIALRARGIDLALGRQVTAILDGDKVTGVSLDDGRVIPCDLVVVGVGVKTNYDLLADAGADINAGIIVDDHMATSLPGIYAAGDVAEHFDLARGERGIVAVWPSAAAQGRVAGYNMAGLPREHRGSLAVNATEIGGLPLASAGLPAATGVDDREYFTLDSTRMTYRKIVTRKGRLAGMTLIGDLRGAGVITGLIARGAVIEGHEKEFIQGNFGVARLWQQFRNPAQQGWGRVVANVF
ncbi:Nitrite reductase [NAD(P)H] [Neomoorella glycerini]|uniref:Nitrite reductase [NAD(P)H] n=1 Tax=Neomoorella glycerini TaxID=55779 RepID=A0A6I5ZNN4_9FIRM|nr:FAD-dependent oxidoreductase [Moorella glycerini]QGP91564.1 Nitrite reductase [NAD(P)H] [Moorella glycerini]